MHLFRGKSRRWKLIAAAISAVVLSLVGYFSYWSSTNAAMLRLLPDSLPSNPALYRFAVAEGHSVFNQNCASCHGRDLRGSQTSGVPKLTDRDWLYGEGRLSEIEQIALYGIRSANHRTKNLADMPAFGRQKPYARYDIAPLTTTEISDIVSYIELAQGRSPDMAAVKRGIDLFDRKGQCFDCHGNDMGGDNYIGAPMLSDKIWLYGDGSREAIARSIEQGRMGVCPMFKDKISPAKIRAVAAYVHSKAPVPPPAD